MKRYMCAFACLSLALLCACNAPSTDSSAPAASTSEPAAAGASVASGPGVAGNSVTVESKNGGYPAGLEFSSVKAAVASYGLAGIDKSRMTIMLANDDLAGVDLNSPKLADGQGIVKIMLSRPDQKELTTGTYTPNAKTDADMRADAGIVVAKGTTVQFTAAKTEGTVNITELTVDRVAGTFDLKDPWSHVSGKFDARIGK